MLDAKMAIKKWKCVPIISATVRPLENLPLGKPLPKSMPYQGRLAWARLLERYLLFPTSERESPNMNCTILQWHPSSSFPKMTITIKTNPTLRFIFVYLLFLQVLLKGSNFLLVSMSNNYEFASHIKRVRSTNLRNIFFDQYQLT